MRQVHILSNPQLVCRRRAAVYCRVSTDGTDQETSMQGQRDHFLKEIDRHRNLILADLYYEQGLSGTGKEERPELQRLLEDCRKGKIDTVLTKSVSRFSRNTADCLEMTRTLASLGVNVVFEKENIDTASMEGELFLTLLSSMAEEESRSISANCRWAVRRRFQAGTFKLSRAPYGYRLEEGNLIPEPAEAAIVRKMYEAVIGGTGTTTLARKLNESGVATKRGGTWHASTILRILANEIYMGDLRMQKTWRDADYKPHLNHGEADQFYIRDHHEALVSRAVFQKAREAVRARDHGTGPGVHDHVGHGRQNHYFLSGKIFCSCCGKPMVHRILHRKAGNVSVWYCKSHLKDAASCSMRWIEESRIQRTFLRMLPVLWNQRTEIFHHSSDTPSQAISEQTILQIREDRQELLAAYTDRRISPAEYYQKLAASIRQEKTVTNRQQIQEHRREAILTQELFAPVKEWVAASGKSQFKQPPVCQDFPADMFAAIVDSVQAGPVLVFNLKHGIRMQADENDGLTLTCIPEK